MRMEEIEDLLSVSSLVLSPPPRSDSNSGSSRNGLERLYRSAQDAQKKYQDAVQNPGMSRQQKMQVYQDYQRARKAYEDARSRFQSNR